MMMMMMMIREYFRVIVGVRSERRIVGRVWPSGHDWWRVEYSH